MRSVGVLLLRPAFSCLQWWGNEWGVVRWVLACGLGGRVRAGCEVTVYPGSHAAYRLQGDSTHSGNVHREQ